ncbi:hypothetical protein LVY75_33105 (plasmid) [Sinorhizobium sp. B11]
MLVCLQLFVGMRGIVFGSRRFTDSVSLCLAEGHAFLDRFVIGLSQLAGNDGFLIGILAGVSLILHRLDATGHVLVEGFLFGLTSGHDRGAATDGLVCPRNQISSHRAVFDDSRIGSSRSGLDDILGEFVGIGEHDLDGVTRAEEVRDGIGIGGSHTRVC